MVTITIATDMDAEGVSAAAAASWQATYRGLLSDDFIARFVERYYSVDNLKNAFAQAESTFLVAKDGEQIIGFCEFGKAIHMEQGVELYRLYLIPAYWRQGIGGQLIAQIEDMLRAQGVVQYFCYVHAENEVGKGFYHKHGFVHDPAHDVHAGMYEWYMVKNVYA
ncbi:MAG: hypothetical protein OHK0046_40910 [Anaerolineae bacterium]